ncbi:bifunctional Chaperone J-domain superfamily/DnaJ domain/DnaJ domain [Babesia duncani]|uniref:Bifunctional Chaperone J-domain superfamily/DnaJ domain/DnaJ domain n=1 Tax=Babesia duncani TaxID=323732 RepID=A0AAD9UN74_9APIC|nr:bifunctional Chaperone J-domain superfamily/DnaJ domain/DnaJ domain [Babesia duncani]
MKNYYIILDVAKNASRNEIRRAYLKKAKLYHPDLNPTPTASNKFKEIQEAYNTLYNEEKRRVYDQQQSFGKSSCRNPSYDSSHTRATYRNTNTGAMNFEDQFRAEAEQLRRQWQEMESDKLRRDAEEMQRRFNSSNLEGMHFFYSFKSHHFRFLFYLINRLLPVLFFPFVLFMMLSSELPDRPLGMGKRPQIVYDSFGRAYALDNQGRRLR